MEIVIVGSGAREHALERKLRKDGHQVLVTPGRAGIPGSTSIPPEDLDTNLFIIGPEAPLVDGLADRLRRQGKRVFGPGRNDARLEGSKIYMKEVLTAAGVPTADYETFVPGDEETAERFIRNSSWGEWVIKTDYLAAGKGVLVTSDQDEAIADAIAKLQKGGIVIEKVLKGEEVSFFAVCSGQSWVLLPPARDYKRLHDGDVGPNTGGMGSFSPVADSPALEVIASIIDPVLAQLEDFRGVLFGGLMLTEDGVYVLEFNIRFGDPEIQSIAGRLSTNLGSLLAYAAAGKPLPKVEVEARDACVTVVMASEGYGSLGGPITGDVITGIDEANQIEGVTVFHAGTSRNDKGNFLTTGGRVLSVTAQAPTVAEARSLVYKAVACIDWRGVHYRTDIAAGV